MDPGSDLLQVALQWLSDASGQEQEALLSVKFATMVVCPPIGEQKHSNINNFRSSMPRRRTRRRVGQRCSGN
jgi:hypothetical protein